MRDAKRRLRPLDRIDPPDVWHRAATFQPVGDLPEAPQASWQKRVAAGAVALAVFAGAVALALGIFGTSEPGRPLVEPPRPDSAILITLDASSGRPRADLAIDGETIEGFGTSYCWNEGNSSMCADTTAPEIGPEDLVQVGPETPLEVDGDAESVDVNLLAFPLESFERVGRVQLEEGTGTLPTQAGRYVLEVVAGWPQGGRAFYFGVEIVQAEASSSPEPPSLEPFDPIEVTAPARGDDVTSPVTITGTADVFEATVSVEIYDATNNLIAEAVTMANCGTGCRGNFSVDVPYSVGESQPGMIRVFEVSAMDGSKINVVGIPVTLYPGPEDPVAEAVEGVWTDADGNSLPDGTKQSEDFGLVLHAFEGPDHCGWTSVTFLHLGWPLGTSTEPPGDFRQYVRDPQGVLSDFHTAEFGSGGRFPDDAVPSGFHRGDWELWTAPSDEDEAVYVVNGDPRAGGIWERWPRTTELVLCR